MLLFLIVAVLAPFGDYWHVETVITHDIILTPNIANSPIWFICLVGIFGVSLGMLSECLRKVDLLPSEKSNILRMAMISVFACLAVYFATSLVPKTNVMLSAMLLMSFALLIWAVVDAKPRSFFIGMLAAVVGMSTEIGLILLGIYHYDADISVIWCVPPWLAPIFFLLGVSVTKLEEFLDLKFR